MDYRKIDAALAAALDTVQNPEERMLIVFIHTANEPGAVEAEFMKRRGISTEAGKGRVFTATVSSRTVADLANQPWVSSLRLSQKLRLVRQK